MAKTFIFGHKSPDTDTITAAIVYANLKRELGMEVEPVRLGEVNKETQYALDYFEAEAPALIETVPENSDVILVDHNEFQQSVDNIQDARIVEVIDHHRVANFETKEPLLFRIEPVGCTATILKKMYEENNVKITKKTARLLLSAIISDSLLFKSPTCTQEDLDAAKELADIAGVDSEQYGFDMLKAGADLSGNSAADLISMDAKEFDMNGSKVEIAQVNAVDTGAVLADQDGLEAAMKEEIENKNLDMFLLVVTDIINSNSDALALGNAKDNVEKAFDVALDNNRALLKGVVSRKKQIVTNLTEAFQ